MHRHSFQQLLKESTPFHRMSLTSLVVVFVCLFAAGCRPSLSAPDKQTIKDLAARAGDVLAREEKAKAHRTEVNKEIQSLLDEERGLAGEVRRLQDVTTLTDRQRKDLVAAKEHWYGFRKQMRQRLDDLNARVAKADREEKAINAEKMALQASAKAESEKLNKQK